MVAATQVFSFLGPGEPRAEPASPGAPGRRLVLGLVLPCLLAGAVIGWHFLLAPPAPVPRPGPRRYPAAYQSQPRPAPLAREAR